MAHKAPKQRNRSKPTVRHTPEVPKETVTSRSTSFAMENALKIRAAAMKKNTVSKLSAAKRECMSTNTATPPSSISGELNRWGTLDEEAEAEAEAEAKKTTSSYTGSLVEDEGGVQQEQQGETITATPGNSSKTQELTGWDTLLGA